MVVHSGTKVQKLCEQTKNVSLILLITLVVHPIFLGCNILFIVLWQPLAVVGSLLSKKRRLHSKKKEPLQQKNVKT